MIEVYRHVIHHLVSWRFLPTAHSIHTSVRSRAIHLVLRKAINHLVPCIYLPCLELQSRKGSA